MKSEFITAITALAAEKNLSKEIVLGAVETALASAYKRDSLAQSELEVRIDPEDGSIRTWSVKTVVEEVEDEHTQLTLDDARRIKPDAVMGERLKFPADPANAGRIAAQTAKQVVLQRLREAEREVVFDEFSGKEGEIISGVVQRLEGRNAIVDLGRAEALLPAQEQARTEHYRPTQRLKVMVVEVQKAAKGPQVIVSRAHKDLLRRLFELEVPEIARGIVEIKSIAREAGYRSKVAVWSRQEGVDPVGACVGQRGLRIQNIVNELNGERIDVVVWDPEPSRFVANALSPAQVVSVISREDADEDGSRAHTAEVVVPDRQLSLAIGKEGQNARLAAKLTGWRIDIKSQSAYEEELAAQGLTLEQVQEQAREEALRRSRELAAAEAEARRAAAEAVAAAAARPLTPEEEIAREYAGAEPEPVPVAEPEPVAPAATAEPATAAPGGPARPTIRFAEELVRPPLDLPKPGEKRRGPPGRRDDDAGRQLPKKKKGGARRILPIDEDEEDLDVGEIEDINW